MQQKQLPDGFLADFGEWVYEHYGSDPITLTTVPEKVYYQDRRTFFSACFSLRTAMISPVKALLTEAKAVSIEVPSPLKYRLLNDLKQGHPMELWVDPESRYRDGNGLLVYPLMYVSCRGVTLSKNSIQNGKGFTPSKPSKKR